MRFGSGFGSFLSKKCFENPFDFKKISLAPPNFVSARFFLTKRVRIGKNSFFVVIV